MSSGASLETLVIMVVLPVSGKARSIWRTARSKPLLGNPSELTSALPRLWRKMRGMDIAGARRLGDGAAGDIAEAQRGYGGQALGVLTVLGG